MSVSNWNEFVDQTNLRMAALRNEIPAQAKGFGELARVAMAPGALDTKTKELIALGIGITARCDGCIAFHVRAAVKQGATRKEICEAIGVAVYMGGGPSMIYGAEALKAYEELS